MCNPDGRGGRENEAASVVVTTDGGWVEGTASSVARVFLGIPYAQPPVAQVGDCL